MKPIVIVGCGPGHSDYLSGAATKAVSEAEVLVGAEHLLQLFPDSSCIHIPVTGRIDDVLDSISALGDKRICVLVSGDSGLYSLARRVIERFGRENCRLIPGISSVQVAFARLALPWQDARVLSLHGRQAPESTEELRRCNKMALLLGDPSAAAWAADHLQELGDSYVAVSCENLTLEDERVRFLDPEGLRKEVLPSRTVLLILRRELVQ